MGLTATQWGDALRGNISQCVAAMRAIQTMNQAAEWKVYFSAWLADTSIAKDTRKTLKNLLPAVISMAEDMDDLTLTNLGINASTLPPPMGLTANNDIEADALRITQIDILETARETAHAVLAVSKAGRNLTLTIYALDGTAIAPPFAMIEVLPAVFRSSINWSLLAVQSGYYIIHVQDGHQLDAKIVEIETNTTLNHGKGTISFS